MIDPDIVHDVDFLLDQGVATAYKDQPLAQHWARVGKVQEEAGEAIAELILWTGQNPRKPQDDEAYGRLLAELADTTLTAVYALQHFTKSLALTDQVLRTAQYKHISRLSISKEES
jgi:hypothetical protein